MDDGLIEVELPADYGPHKAGAKIMVDPERKAWIEAHLVPPARPVPISAAPAPESGEPASQSEEEDVHA